jgi:hypothetical protein
VFRLIYIDIAIIKYIFNDPVIFICLIRINQSYICNFFKSFKTYQCTSIKMYNIRFKLYLLPNSSEDREMLFYLYGSNIVL